VFQQMTGRQFANIPENGIRLRYILQRHEVADGFFIQLSGKSRMLHQTGKLTGKYQGISIHKIEQRFLSQPVPSKNQFPFAAVKYGKCKHPVQMFNTFTAIRFVEVNQTLCVGF
jgi:hypothetical protein